MFDRVVIAPLKTCNGENSEENLFLFKLIFNGKFVNYRLQSMVCKICSKRTLKNLRTVWEVCCEFKDIMQVLFSEIILLIYFSDMGPQKQLSL